jgi:hypothetical protein
MVWLEEVVGKAELQLYYVQLDFTVEKFQQTYRKKWRFLTSANANVILAEAASGERPARWALTTGMASIPWEYLFFYMSPAEYNRMKNYPGTFAKSLQYVLGRGTQELHSKPEILKQLMLH